MTTELQHESLNQLIPWYVNGTLSPEESDQLEQHLKSCVSCQSEVEWMRNVGTTMTGLANEPFPAKPSFDKALAAVEHWEQSKNDAPLGWLTKLWKEIWNSATPIARYAMAAQLAAIAILCVALWFSHHPTTPPYTVLSGDEPSNSGGVRLTVSFAPDTTVDQVRQILGDIGGNIIGGPSANGICIVQLPTSASKDSDVQVTIDELHKNKAVRFVERLP